MIPKIRSLINGFKHMNAIKAPNGSAIPEIKEYLRALALLLLAK